MKRLLLTPLAAICLYWSSAAISADFVVVRIEAEDFTSKSDRWVLTSPTSTPSNLTDPDPAHNDSASGNANLELLPDTRVNHGDDLVSGGLDGNFWGGPGGGPRIDYNIDIPEPGRYFLYVKTYSTGTEDNGLHVGINNTLPDSGQRIQICSKHNWFWTSGQRTNDNHCGVTKTIWLDVPAAGPNTITFFAREDGFELDQFLLLKETHDGSLDCFPNFGDKIRCRDVATGATISDTEVNFSQTIGGDSITNPPVTTPQDIDVDLGVDINAAGSSYFINDTVEFLVKVSNNSDQSTATNTVATINLPAELQYIGSSVCSETSNTVSCDFDNLSANSNDTVSFFAKVLEEGNYRADAQVSSDEEDSISSNNTDSASVSAAFTASDYEAGITLKQGSNASSVGGQNSYVITVTNNGLQEISTASLKIDLGTGISLDPSQGCSSNCVVPNVPAGQSIDMYFYTVASTSGDHTVNVQLLLTNDANSSNNTVSVIESVVASPIAIGDITGIVIEAESFSALSPAVTNNAPQWYLVNRSFAAFDTTIDPDQASPIGVSGDAYMELLPDTRIDANGARTEDMTNFDSGGVGATLSYNVFFHEAGTYNVLARIRANNTEDGTLHIGINNTWPNTSASLSVCNPNGTWQWTSNLKTDSGCAITSSATINVDIPGMHVLMISQDTDGLELDKLILSKDQILDLTDNGPAAITINSALNADIAVSSSVSTQNATINEAVQLVVLVENKSSTQEALGIELNISGLTQQLQATTFDHCKTTISGTVCSLARVAAGQSVTEIFDISTNEESTFSIQTSVTSVFSDDNTENNSDNVTLDISNNSSSTKASASTGGGSISVWFLAMLLLPFGTTVIRNRQPVAQNKAQFLFSKTYH